MARKPSERTNRIRDVEELNLTSIMDIVTTMMFFLLVFANVIPVVIIDAPLPKIAETAKEVRQAEKKEDKLEVTVSITSNGFTVSSSKGGGRQFQLLEGKYPYDLLHKYLVELKPQMQTTSEITLNPSDDVEYETIIATMDASRELGKDDPGYQEVPPDIAQTPESTKFNRLFPDVNLGGI